MWTAVKPPPSPTEMPSKSYRSERQQTELDQLRQRGLAKLLNKHFTNVTQTLAEERAAADAALRDLESRKAAGLKDWDSNSGELNVWDKMYLELQQKKAECKRKERETLLLYQRYVDRFGSTGVVAVPRSPTHVADATAPVPAKGFSPSTPTNTKVPHLAGQIESNLASLTGAERHPSIMFLGKDKTQQQAFANMDKQERMAFMRTLEGRGIDAHSTPSPQMSRLLTSKDGIPESPNLTTDFPWAVDTPTTSYLTATTTSFPEDDLDEDIRSILSGLTTSGDFSNAERVLIEFLKTETEAIRQLLDDEDAVTVASIRSSYSSELLSQSAMAADEAEDLVKKMEQMLRDFTSSTKAEDAHEPRKLETSNPDEEWMIYWDDMAQRHYYYELRTNKAQWAKPSGAKTFSTGSDAVRVVDYTRSSSDRSVDISHYEVTPMDDVPRQSRREQYRQKRRRRRNRRLVFLVFLTMSAVGAALYVNLYHHEETKSTLVRALGSTEQAELVIDTIEAYLPDSITGRSERNEKKIRQENARKAKMAAEQKAKMAAEQKAKMAAEQKAKMAAEQKAKEEKILREKIAKEQEEAEEKPPFKSSWACHNPYFFMVNNKRGLC